MITNLVLDASAAMKWLLADAQYGEPLAILCSAKDIYCPTLCIAEISNSLWQMARQGLLSSDEANGHLEDFLSLKRLHFYPDATIASRALQITQHIGHNATYDCFYLALAEKIGSFCLTADKKLCNRVENTLYAPLVKHVSQLQH